MAAKKSVAKTEKINEAVAEKVTASSVETPNESVNVAAVVNVTAETAKVTADEAQAETLETAQKTTVSNTVTVALNWARAIQFEVRDNSGVVQKVKINGNGTPLIGKEMGVLSVGSFGLTPNVPREAWEAIQAQYLSKPPFDNLVKKGLIFATDNTYGAEQEANTRRSTRNGHEPIDPRSTKTQTANTSEV